MQLAGKELIEELLDECGLAALSFAIEYLKLEHWASRPDMTLFAAVVAGAAPPPVIVL